MDPGSAGSSSPDGDDANVIFTDPVSFRTRSKRLMTRVAKPADEKAQVSTDPVSLRTTNKRRKTDAAEPTNKEDQVFTDPIGFRTRSRKATPHAADPADKKTESRHTSSRKLQSRRTPTATSSVLERSSHSRSSRSSSLSSLSDDSDSRLPPWDQSVSRASEERKGSGNDSMSDDTVSITDQPEVATDTGSERSGGSISPSATASSSDSDSDDDDDERPMTRRRLLRRRAAESHSPPAPEQREAPQKPPSPSSSSENSDPGDYMRWLDHRWLRRKPAVDPSRRPARRDPARPPGPNDPLWRSLALARAANLAAAGEGDAQNRSSAARNAERSARLREKAEKEMNQWLKDTGPRREARREPEPDPPQTAMQQPPTSSLRETQRPEWIADRVRNMSWEQRVAWGLTDYGDEDDEDDEGDEVKEDSENKEADKGNGGDEGDEDDDGDDDK